MLLEAGLASVKASAYGAARNRKARSAGAVDFLDLVTQVIDLRSFSNLWYWMVLAILWSTLSHWVLGIPNDLIQRARRGDGESLDDLRILAEINSRRILKLADLSGIVMVASSSFVLSALVVLGWVYGIEFAQAILLLVLPLLSVTALSVHTARRLIEADFDDLPNRLRTHRLMVQGMGVIFIFLTAFWGMYVNLSFSRLY